jgi:hypothetical protein
MKNFIIALKNDTVRHFFFNEKHIFYERKQVKKLALFLTDVKIVYYIIKSRSESFCGESRY